MHIHSVDDPRALYQGGLGPRFPMTDRRVRHPDIEAMLKKWIQHNGCSSEPVIEATIRGEINSSSNSQHTATKHTFTQVEGGNDIVLWKLTGAGHVWPGGLANYLENFLGESTKVIDANREIWNYFSCYSLSGDSQSGHSQSGHSQSGYSQSDKGS